MNYIWYPLIEAIQSGYDTTKIRYRVSDRKFHYDVGDDTLCYSAGAHHMSPYLEYMPVVLFDPDKTLTSEDKFSRVDVNPHHRFGSIFNHILKPERNDPNDLVICDIITHMLAHIDRICGMSKRDFIIFLVLKEIDDGCYGDKEVIKLFNVLEKRVLAEALITLYKTSNGLRCLADLFTRIMTDFFIMIRDKKEVVFCNLYGFDDEENKKLLFIIKMFLPIDFPFVIHWKYTYGTIGLDESMALEEFVL